MSDAKKELYNVLCALPQAIANGEAGIMDCTINGHKAYAVVLIERSATTDDYVVSPLLVTPVPDLDLRDPSGIPAASLTDNGTLQ